MIDFQKRVTETHSLIASLSNLEISFHSAADCCLTALKQGGKLLICGNGGSAAEAQHLAGELLGHYKSDRTPLPAIALTADSAVLTCIANDYRFQDVFARQIQALGRPGDVLVAFSTSGNSPNVVQALLLARAVNMASVAFLGGADGGPAGKLADHSLIVPHPDTARIQECHQFLMHCLMDSIDAGISLSETQ
jgi:D-sedoheptulose 7-phosphate isomerase